MYELFLTYATFCAFNLNTLIGVEFKDIKNRPDMPVSTVIIF
jgi:hypothetical protein